MYNELMEKSTLLCSPFYMHMSGHLQAPVALRGQLLCNNHLISDWVGLSSSLDDQQ